MYYTATTGHQIMDATAGLWCVNAGHGRQEITDAIAQQTAELDYAPSFQLGHLDSFRAASAIANLMPERKSVVKGQSVSVRVDIGGRRIIKTKKNNTTR